jgi:hypothetical protein
MTTRMTGGPEPADSPVTLAAAVIRSRTLYLLGLVLLILAACDSTGPEQSLWGSEQASLTVTEASATLQIVASGDCYGSYGEIAQPVFSGSFTLSGTYTQLLGVYPGHIDYAATFTGTINRGLMTLSVTVPALQQTVGPFQLTHGEGKTWPACLYP